MRRTLPLLLALLPTAALANDRPDVVLADFEGDTYGEGWVTTGTAFGDSPAKGTLPGQMEVSGYLGKGLVNSFRGGDKATGTLTSPEFTIDRDYINFLVGGGKHYRKTCINLLIDGKIRQSTTGPNDQPGGTERLEWQSWDVAYHRGETARIQIVDEATGGWGHVNVDQITLSDTRKQTILLGRAFVIDRQYLHLPVKNGAPKRRMKVFIRHDVRPRRAQIKDELVREFDIELATEGKPDFWVFADVSEFKGETLIVKTVLPANSKALDAIEQSDAVPNDGQLYREPLRPRFHFTSRRGWLNDPNGLVYHAGEWHLFYQHNPYGREWGNMHWGHAVSKDLVHWKELGIGLYPKAFGDWAFSGSAVVDTNNTSGWGTEENPPLVLAYTSTGRGECVAYSTDHGRTWKEHTANPVVEHRGRDPKLVWYAPGKHWVMAVYDEHDGKQWIAFYTSPDLKKWTFASRIEGFYECPDLFKLPVYVGGFAPEICGSKWILYGADGKYLVGDFDGKEFKPDVKEKIQLWYGNFYAAQTFNNGPPRHKPSPIAVSDREHRVQIGWARGVTFSGMPFNQQMTVPVQLSLRRSTEDAPTRLTVMPIPELDALRDDKPVLSIDVNDEDAFANVRTLVDDLDAFDAEFSIDTRNSAGFSLDLRGTKLVYDTKTQSFTCNDVTAPAEFYEEAKVHFRVLVDRGSVEVFANAGRVAMSVAAVTDEKNHRITITPTAGAIRIRDARVWKMKSAWEE